MGQFMAWHWKKNLASWAKILCINLASYENLVLYYFLTSSDCVVISENDSMFLNLSQSSARASLHQLCCERVFKISIILRMCADENDRMSSGVHKTVLENWQIRGEKINTALFTCTRNRQLPKSGSNG